MAEGTEPIRQDIDSIRDSMTDKMEQIESKIKGTVGETTESVKRAVDVKYHVSQRPWAAFGASVIVGYALGSMGSSRQSEQPYSGYDYQHAGYGSSASSYRPSAQQSSEPGFMDQMKDQFGDEFEALKAAAITSLIGLVRDTVKQNVPALHQEYERVRREREEPHQDMSTSHHYETTGAISTPSTPSQRPAERAQAVGSTTEYDTTASKSML